MKYIISSILLLSLLLAFCLVSAIYVTTSIRNTEAFLHQAVYCHNTGATEQAAANVQTAFACWRSKQNYFSTVLEHKTVDTVSESFARLQAYSTSEDQDDFLSNCEELLISLEHIREMEWPYYYNIL